MRTPLRLIHGVTKSPLSNMIFETDAYLPSVESIKSGVLKSERRIRRTRATRKSAKEIAERELLESFMAF